MRGGFRARHRPRHHEPDKSFRSVFHDETRWLGDRSCVEPANRGSAWRFVDSGESRGAGLRSAVAIAEVESTRGRTHYFVIVLVFVLVIEIEIDRARLRARARA